MKHQVWMAFLVCTILSGCMQLDRLAPERRATIKRVGVISITAQEFHRRYTGAIVFGNEAEKVDIRDWGVDDAYETQISEVIPKAGPFQAVKANYDRSVFLPVYDLNGPWDASAFRTPKWSAVEGAFKEHARKHSLDVIVVAIRMETGDFFTMSNQQLRGAGTYARGFGQNTGVSVLHLFSTVALIDGATGKPLLTRWLATTQEPIRGGANIQRAMPYIEISPAQSRTPTAAWTPDVKDSIRKALVDLPKEAWATTVVSMF